MIMATVESDIAVIKNELTHIKKNMLTKDHLLGLYIRVSLWGGSIVFGSILIGIIADRAKWF